jgi:hypothetical protein
VAKVFSGLKDLAMRMDGETEPLSGEWKFAVIFVAASIVVAFLFAALLVTLGNWTSGDATLFQVIASESRWLLRLLHRIW